LKGKPPQFSQILLLSFGFFQNLSDFLVIPWVLLSSPEFSWVCFCYFLVFFPSFFFFFFFFPKFRFTEMPGTGSKDFPSLTSSGRSSPTPPSVPHQVQSPHPPQHQHHAQPAPLLEADIPNNRILLDPVSSSPLFPLLLPAQMMATWSSLDLYVTFFFLGFSIWIFNMDFQYGFSIWIFPNFLLIKIGLPKWASYAEEVHDSESGLQATPGQIQDQSRTPDVLSIVK